MKKIFLVSLLGLLILTIFSCKENPTETIEDGNCDSCAVVYKPNIYLYPTTAVELSVKIEFPSGGKVLKSIPEYNGLWNVQVAPDGKINDEYAYLFYEAQMQDLMQKKCGWLVQKKDLKDFFQDNLSSSGFNEKEISDFTEYWVTKLNDFDYYEIYPQYKSTIDKMIKIIFSKSPDNFYRLFYFIKGRMDADVSLDTPKIEKAERENYFVVEWGVIL